MLSVKVLLWWTRIVSIPICSLVLLHHNIVGKALKLTKMVANNNNISASTGFR